jgi:hypothetical protein
MDIVKALEVLDDAREDAGMHMLEFLQYMSECNLYLDDSFTHEQVHAYRIAMRDFRKLLMPKDTYEY